ncbi:MAG TPA: ParB N-terminal domain-containing protein [bacterium]|nr:ParB N-terminal domain-containing protein [bacterium]
MNQPSALRLATGQLLPDLRIAATEEVFVHEDHDPVRVDRLVASLRADRVLRNPPIAAPLSSGSYVVLDGANRAGALASIGIKAIPLQVVDYDDGRVELEVWHHFVVDEIALFSKMSGAGLTLEAMSMREAQEALAGRALACYLVTKDNILGVRSGSPMGISLARVVAAYRGAARIYRVQGGAYAELVRNFGTDGTLIVFPSFTKTDIVAFARARAKLPSGITRHVISGRALRLNLPLEALSKPDDLGEKNRWLSELIRQKLLDNRIRYYPEATFLFDE